jgi:hypothetical protein
VAAAALIGPLATRRAEAAALITFDLRATGANALDSKSATIPASGGTVTFDIYAVMQNLDGNHNSEGFVRMHTSLLSTEAADGWAGNISAVTLDTTYVDPSLSQTGNAVNLDSNLDMERGSADTAVAGYVAFTSGLSPRFSTAGTGTGATEFRLGSASWVAGVNALPRTPTSLQLALRVAPGTLVSAKTVSFVTDGTTWTVKGDDPLVAIGAPIVIGVPEPAAPCVLGLAGASAALQRRRRRPAPADVG